MPSVKDGCGDPLWKFAKTRPHVAVRGVALYNDQKYAVNTAFQRDKRLFATVTYAPFVGTTLRSFYEAQNSTGRRPNSRTVQDNVSGWLNAYNTYAPQMTAAQVAAAFYWDGGLRNAANTAGTGNGLAVFNRRGLVGATGVGDTGAWKRRAEDAEPGNPETVMAITAES